MVTYQVGFCYSFKLQTYLNIRGSYTVYMILLNHCKKQQNEENPNIALLQLDSTQYLGSL